MKFAWSNYKKYAWGADEIKPISKEPRNWMNLSLTIVDSIDTLWIMDLKEEYEDAREFISKMDFQSDIFSSVFEINIRLLGGLLSIYSLTDDFVFLLKAKQLGNLLLQV